MGTVLTGMEAGGIAAGGAILMKGLDVLARFIPYFNKSNGNGYHKEMEKAISDHESGCKKVMAEVFKGYDQRFESGVEEMKMLRQDIRDNHQAIMNQLIELAGKR